MFGPFLSMPSRMFTQFLHTFDNMLSCTLVFLCDLFKVIMVANLIMLPIKISFSPMVFLFVFLAPTHPLKIAKLNVLFVPLMTFFANCSFRLPFHLVFWVKLSAPLNFAPYTHLFNLFFFTIPITLLFMFLYFYVFLVPPLLRLINLHLAPCLASILDFPMITKAFVASIHLLDVYLSLVMSL
jgi:hypothetical protein